MANLPEMTKHKGFPSGMPSTGVQFTIRRANPKGVTPIKMKNFDPGSYQAMRVIDARVARQNFPESFENFFEI